MSRFPALRRAVLAALLTATWPLAAAATTTFSNTIGASDLNPAPPNNGYNTPAVLSVPFTLNHPNPANGFASSQGSTDGTGAGMAVHARAVGVGDIIASSESIILTDFQIFHPLGSLVDVTITGTYRVEVFGQGIAQVEGWLCQTFANLCQFGGTRIFATLASDSIFSNLSPTNEAKVETYIWSGQLPSNVPLSMRLRAQASAVTIGTNSRAFLDPTFTISTQFGSLTLESGAMADNPNYIPPPVPEPATALLLLPIGWVLARRR